MSTATTKLLSEFESLPAEEKQEFVREVIHHLPPWDSGPLNDSLPQIGFSSERDLVRFAHPDEASRSYDPARCRCRRENSMAQARSSKTGRTRGTAASCPRSIAQRRAYSGLHGRSPLSQRIVLGLYWWQTASCRSVVR